MAKRKSTIRIRTRSGDRDTIEDIVEACRVEERDAEREAHTPGPWRVLWRGFDDRDFFISTERTAAVRYSTPVCQAILRKDADLVAAAPELLAALRNLVCCMPESRSAVMQRAVENANDAIAKATQE